MHSLLAMVSMLAYSSLSCDLLSSPSPGGGGGGDVSFLLNEGLVCVVTEEDSEIVLLK